MSTKQTEALKLALLALEECRRDPRLKYEHPYYDKAITAIREALADHIGDANKMVEQPAQQQEPFNKYCCRLCFNNSGQMFLDRMILCPECGNKRCPKATYHELPCTNSNEPGQPGSIYTPPPASKPWVGLTSEERDAILNREFKQWWSRHDAVCRAIEAKLKDKNGY